MERTIVTNVIEKKAVHVFVSGSIGVGKSTVLAYLKNRWVGINGLHFIKEYIDYDPDGKDRLQDSLEGKLSLKDFQLYIVDCFCAQLKAIFEKDWYDTIVVIWERHPMEALEIFARNLNEEDTAIVRKAIVSMLNEFDIPDLIGSEITTVLKFDTRIVNPIHVSENLYQHMLDLIASDESCHVWCYLHCDVGGVEQYARIRRRGRACEIEEYGGNDKLMKLNVLYHYLFKRLKAEVNNHWEETFN